MFFVIFEFGMDGLIHMEEHSAESSPVVSFCLLNINLGSALKDKMCAGEGDIGTWEKGRHPRYSCFHISFLLVMFCFVLDCP